MRLCYFHDFSFCTPQFLNILLLWSSRLRPNHSCRMRVPVLCPSHDTCNTNLNYCNKTIWMRLEIPLSHIKIRWQWLQLNEINSTEPGLKEWSPCKFWLSFSWVSLPTCAWLRTSAMRKLYTSVTMSILVIFIWS